MQPTRRELLQLMGAGVAGLAVGCGDNTAPDPSSAAAAVLEPDTESFLVAVWTRLGVPRATLELRTAGVLMREAPVALIDGIGVGQLDGLAADTPYEVTI